MQSLRILDAAARLREGTLQPVDLVDECLRTIDRREPAIHAWVQLDRDGAMTAAEQLGREAAAGHWRGVLHGIPIGVKDIIDVAGLPTRAGSPLRAGHIARRDADAVGKLRRHGAIILGKTVTTQFACFDPAATVNPHAVDRTPGGSSSGSAAALACDMCLAALGSQTGGSIIRPAAYCGVCGLKPTLDAWSTQGVVPVSFHLDHIGPMGRDVSDLACMWSSDRAVADVRAFVEEDAATTPPRLVVPESFLSSQVSDEVKTVVNACVAQLARHGAEIRSEVFPGDLTEVLAMHRRIMAVEAAEYHRQVFADNPDAFAPNVAELINEGLRVSSVDYAAALKHRRDFTRTLARRLEAETVWLTPATTTTAPPRASTGNPAFNSPWSYCGFPTLCFPCGMDSSHLPVGIQLIGPPHSETTLLQAGLWCERTLELETSWAGI